MFCCVIFLLYQAKTNDSVSGSSKKALAEVKLALGVKHSLELKAMPDFSCI